MMQLNLDKNRWGSSFVLAVLLHLLFLATIATQITFQFQAKPDEKKSPHYYVPAYVYKGAMTPAPVSHAQKANAHASQPQPKSQKIPTTPHPHATLTSGEKALNTGESILDMSRNLIRADSAAQAIRDSKSQTPILLIGDMSQPADPLIKLLGASLSAHFSYPKIEGNFGIRGRVLVGLTLHPEGYYSDVELVESSDNQDFDNAALSAVNSAPKVIGADRFLEQPKHFIVGFIFD